MSSPLLTADGVSIEVGGRRLLEGLSFALAAATSLAILGCNGSGKSSLLHTLAGLRRATAGTVTLGGVPLAEQRRVAVARQLGLLLQEQHDPFPTSVDESVLTGRHPHLTHWQREGVVDRTIAQAALAEMAIAGLADRQVDTLSGGERQRLAIATLFTQQPPLMLLDEPTNHLDLRHQRQVLEAIQRRVTAGAAAIMVLHDINQAARYCDQVLLLYGDGGWELGRREQMLDEERLTRLYGTRIRVTETPQGRLFYTE